MPKTVYKLGTQSHADALEFVMSTSSVDRVGDVVEQDWDLEEFKRNPIALYNHDADLPIGTWERVRVDRGKLVGRLKLAAAGTSKLIDTVRSLVEQRVLRAVSVGFLPGSAEPLKRGGSGLRLSGNRLLECSLVSVPANAEALAITRSLDAAQVRRLLDAKPCARADLCAAEQLSKSRDSDGTSTRVKTMTLSEQIETLRREISAKQEELESLSEKMVTDGLEDEDRERMSALSAEIELGQKDLEAAEAAEKALATKAKQAKPVQRITAKDNTDPEHRLGAALHAIVRGHFERRNPIDLAKQIYRDEGDVQQVVKAAVDPADSLTSGWASELVAQTWSGFLDALRARMTIYPNLPGMREMFNGYGTINTPVNTADTLAGGFTAEGAPIAVKAGTFSNIQMAPKKMAVITTVTDEILRRSTPAIEGILRNQLVLDTAKAIDTVLLSNTARSAITPAGLQNDTEVGAANTNNSAGATVANVIADIGTMFGLLEAAGMGATGVWVMNPARVRGLRYKQDAASGLMPFRAEVDAGMLNGHPILISENVPSSVVYFVDSRAMVFASDVGPVVDMTNTATLHMENTAPAAIVEDDSGTAAPAIPVRSLWQTDSHGLRLRWGMDWRVARQAGVQVLQSCSW